MLTFCVCVLLLWTLYGALSQKEIIQLECFKKAKLGETVVLKCLTNSIWRYRVWYKQSTNKTLLLLASTENAQKPKVADKRYLMESSAVETNLTIMKMTMEDVGTYYCGIFKSRDVIFGSGSVLEIEGGTEPFQSVLQRPEFIRAQPGDSVTLSCLFTSSQSQMEQTRVTWIKSGSASEIGSWNYGNEKIFCENTECVHNLTLKDISSAEDGTYLCVVTVCGDTVIGSATRIHVYGPFTVGPTVIALAVLNVVFAAAAFVLVWVVCSYRRKLAKEVDACRESGEIMTEGDVTYARVNVVHKSAPRRSTSVAPRQDTVFYSEVRSQHV